MEAPTITPVTAKLKTAEAQVPSGLGDLFQILLRENTLHLDAPATAFFLTADSDQTTRPRSSVTADRRPDPTAPPQEPRREPQQEPAATNYARADNGDPESDSIAPAEPAERMRDADDAETSVIAPSTTDAPPNDDRASSAEVENDSQVPSAEGEPEDMAAATSGDGVTPPEAPAGETGTPAVMGLPMPAQDVAADIAASQAQALGRTAFATQAAAHMAPQAESATSVNPAATTPVASSSGAARVSVTPAPLVAVPNAALGGGAVVAAMTSAAQADPNVQTPANASASDNLASNGKAPAEVTVISLSQFRAQGRNAQTGQAQAASTPTGETGASQTGSATANTQPAQTNPGQGAATQAQLAKTATPANAAGAAQTPAELPAVPAAAEAGLAKETGQAGHSPAPRNAATPNAESHNLHARNSDVPGASASTAQESPTNAKGGNSLNVTDRANPNGQGGTPFSTGQNGQQGANTQTSAKPTENHAPTPNPAQTGQPGEAGTATATAAAQALKGLEQAAQSTSLQRTDGLTSQNASLPGAATAGLGQAAGRIPGFLTAQARPFQMPSVPVEQVAVHIQKAVGAGQSRIQIRLHPAELGQIDVKLNLGSDGTVRAVVSVEKPETFELLQRDARGLERALQDAGLKTNSESLTFNLRGEQHQRSGAGQEEAGAGPDLANDGGDSDTPDGAAAAPVHIMSQHVLDIRV